MASRLGVRPNGIPLQAHDPLWQMPVLPIVGIALVGYVLFAIVGAFWFVRKEVNYVHWLPNGSSSGTRLPCGSRCSSRLSVCWAWAGI
ncbi:hypothetical protein [Ktedonobacter robiniae]|uniref:hypothetical protein n=1 Tax=Ktedonobacter robiniae TaxID=2778365 RepID=UPI00191654E2|nr:hypothetical protein [Ktedonobacter robiniae]